MAIYSRHAESKLVSQLEYQPAVMIEGARQTGKSTLAREIGMERGYAYWTFDDEPTRQSAVDDPSGFVSRLEDRVILDEVQRVPGLGLALKHAIDQDRVNGRFILTGSSSDDVSHELGSALVGRLGFTRLYPLSQSEIAGEPPTLLDRLYGLDFESETCERLGERLARIVFTGGYPAVQSLNSDAAVAGWYTDYVETQVRQVIDDMTRILTGVELRKLIATAATQVAQPTVMDKLAGELGIDRRTARRYYDLLEAVYIVDWVPPWSSNLRKRETKGAKFHLNDTGLASALLGIDPATLWNKRELLGQLFESFVVQEFRRELSWAPGSATNVFHYRANNAHEVDILVDSNDRGRLGIEIKAGATVRPAHFDGLRRLKEVDPDLVASVVIYDGERCLPFADGMWAVPAGMLFGRGG